MRTMKYHKLYTRKGDAGYTTMLDGTSIHKSSYIIEILGRLDHLHHAIGVLHFATEPNVNKEFILSTQKNLISIMGLISAIDVDNGMPGKYEFITDAEVTALLNEIEKVVQTLESQSKSQTDWVLYGSNCSRTAYEYDGASVATRMCEIDICKLVQTNLLPAFVQTYFNGLSKYFYLMARYTSS
jgi:cob(I)alamin adenosyltransferase